VNLPTLLQDYRNCKQGVGMRQATSVSLVEAKGSDFLDLINRISTNHLEDLAIGGGVNTILTTEKGRILDVLTISSIENSYLILTGGSNGQTVVDWIDKFVFMEDVTLTNLSPHFLMLNIIGPHASKILEEFSRTSLLELEPLSNTSITISKKQLTLIRGNLGSLDSFYLIVPKKDFSFISQQLNSRGAHWICEVSWEALRIEYEIPIFGKEIGEQYNPLEVGLENLIDFDKGCYIGQEVIARLDTYNKVKKRLVSLSIDSSYSCSAGQQIYLDGKVVGQVTSIAMHPNGLEYIGLGFLRVGPLGQAENFTLTPDGLGIIRLRRNEFSKP